MVEREYRPLRWYRVINADAQDHDRIGWLVESTAINDILYYILSFDANGHEQTAFTPDELEIFYIS